MKITFPCHGCGKTLKARTDAAGRTRKCPVCATRVTCPAKARAGGANVGGLLDAEVVEAELVPAAPAARRGAAPEEPGTRFNPYADVEDDPYQLADPDPATATTPEPKRPCPICGEMILASAVKCRFCGEVFDPVLKKGKSKKRRKSGGGSGSSGARDIGIGLLCMAIGLGLTIGSFAYAADDGKCNGRFFVFYGLIIGGFIQMCRGIHGVATSG